MARQPQLPRALGTDAVGEAPPTVEVYRIRLLRQQTSNLPPEHRNNSRTVFRSLVNRMLNHAHEDQIRKAEDLDDKEGGAMELDEAGKDRMKTKARNHSNPSLAPCGLEGLGPA